MYTGAIAESMKYPLSAGLAGGRLPEGLFDCLQALGFRHWTGVETPMIDWLLLDVDDCLRLEAVRKGQSWTLYRRVVFEREPVAEPPHFGGDFRRLVLETLEQALAGQRLVLT